VANSSIELRDRFLGCLLGCAVGDALGAPYEGLWSHSIPDIETLLSGFAEFEGFPPGQYTDDTQLSLATVEAILDAEDVIPAVVARHIARLWKTQSVVGPGGACTQAAHRFLKMGDWTSCGAPAGQAGNGTAMRTAVLGLFFLREMDRLPGVVADISRITHQDPRSVAGGVAIAKAAQLLTNDVRSPGAFCQEIAEATEVYEPQFAGMVRELPSLMMKSPQTILQHIAWSGMARPEFDKPIITPFVIPTVLASLWCVLENLDSWSKAVAKALGLGGDVDTLGAVVGALMGTRLGVAGIPGHLVETVLNVAKIRSLAVRYHALVARKG
jgi:ADP-ribosyl-[dinitrogen reductase] hydrolase